MSQIPDDAIKCLDKGFVRLVDSMGGDDAIVQAARVSYGKGTSKVSHDRGLIRYLMRHRHTTPFEMVEFKFHCKMPIFVARQWVRHRTANINEYSLRYSEARDEFYFPNPEHIQFQSSLNKQGRRGDVPIDLKQKVHDYFKEISNRSFEIYSELNDSGVARELARAILPVNLYTEWYFPNPEYHGSYHWNWTSKDEQRWSNTFRKWQKLIYEFNKRGGHLSYAVDDPYIWNTSVIGNVRELREFKEKLASLID